VTGSIRRWGNSWLHLVAEAAFGTRFSDLCYGYNAFWRDLVPDPGSSRYRQRRARLPDDLG
jgi:hypothetical protein